jgi:hypothetical protein
MTDDDDGVGATAVVEDEEAAAAAPAAARAVEVGSVDDGRAIEKLARVAATRIMESLHG